jgi:hypothetical protein
MFALGHQRRFKRKQRTSAYPLIPDMLLRRTALPPTLAADGGELRQAAGAATTLKAEGHMTQTTPTKPQAAAEAGQCGQRPLHRPGWKSRKRNRRRRLEQVEQIGRHRPAQPRARA